MSNTYVTPYSLVARPGTPLWLEQALQSVFPRGQPGSRNSRHFLCTFELNSRPINPICNKVIYFTRFYFTRNIYFPHIFILLPVLLSNFILLYLFTRVIQVK
jgi:hypothetical protein